MLQSGGMRGRGLGWKAERCVDPGTCDLHLCVADDEGGYWHPEDPLAFAKWRVRADLDAIPTHVMVRVRRGWDALRRSLMVGAVGLGGTAALVGICTLTMLLAGRVKLWHLLIVIPPALAAGLWFVIHKE